MRTHNQLHYYKTISMKITIFIAIVRNSDLAVDSPVIICSSLVMEDLVATLPFVYRKLAKATTLVTFGIRSLCGLLLSGNKKRYITWKD